MKVLILAGGFATRLWPLTEHISKPLLPVAGKPIISHVVEKIPSEYEIIVSTNQLFKEAFEKWKNLYPNKKITIFVEDSGHEDFKKGALGATALVIEKMNITEDLALLAGDNLFGFRFANFHAAYTQQPLLAVYDIKNKKEAAKYGVVLTEGERVIAFQEKPENPASTLVSTGCYIFPENTLHHIIHYAKLKKDDLGGIFEYFLEHDMIVRPFRFNEYWYDIGSFSAYLSAHKALQNNFTKEKGVIEKGDNEFIGAVWLQEPAIVMNSIIEDSLIFTGSKIDNCCIRNCIIDAECELKNVDLQWKIIRKKTIIEG